VALFGGFPKTQKIGNGDQVLELAQRERMGCGHLKGQGYHTD
jgi:hypothetical protein